MKAPFRLLLAGCVTLLPAADALAADLRVAPVIVEPLAGSRTSTITLINEEDRPLSAQIRVMRWTQVNGHDVLSPTEDVVASPPLAALKPNEHYLVRLVRTAKTPPVGEESYRVLVDEIPDPARAKPGTVNLILRQSIPAFFSDAPRRAAKVDWTVARSNGGLQLIGRNSGNRRIRLSDLQIEAAGHAVVRQAGLVGYVLPGTEMRFALPEGTAIPAGAALTMKAVADTGPLDVALVAQPGA